MMKNIAILWKNSYLPHMVTKLTEHLIRNIWFETRLVNVLNGPGRTRVNIKTQGCGIELFSP